jgi:hypothetical protein
MRAQLNECSKDSPAAHETTQKQNKKEKKSPKPLLFFTKTNELLFLFHTPSPSLAEP